MPSGISLNVSSHVEARFGGIVSSLPPFCEAMNQAARYRSQTAAFCLPDELAPPGTARSEWHRFDYGWKAWFSDSSLRQRLSSLISASSVCHIHGIWESHCATACGTARRLKRPYVISAHGMLDPWALEQKRLKKAVYSRLVEFRNLSGAACLRALTSNEAEQYRAFGLTNPVAVIPNGVDISADVSPELLLNAHPELRNKRVVLFMGCIHSKKGLFPLCRAWNSVSQRFPDAHLVIAGPDSEGALVELKGIIAGQGAQSSVTFTGSLTGDLKWSAYAAADLFILPSFSEGFSVAVLEALGTRTPVIITEACYFPEVISAKAGWLTKTDDAAIAASLIEALNVPPKVLTVMGETGADLVARRYSWSGVASKFSDLYDWLLDGPRPASFPILTCP